MKSHENLSKSFKIFQNPSETLKSHLISSRITSQNHFTPLGFTPLALRFEMLLMSVAEDDDVIKIDIAVGDTVKDFFGEALEAGRSILDSKGHTEEFEESPGSIDTEFQLILLFDRNKMKSLAHIDFAEDFALLEVGGEVIEIRELVDIRQGGVVDLAKIATRTFSQI